MIEPLEKGEGRPHKLVDKINEVVAEVNTLLEDYNPTEATREERVQEMAEAVAALMSGNKEQEEAGDGTQDQ